MALNSDSIDGNVASAEFVKQVQHSGATTIAVTIMGHLDAIVVVRQQSAGIRAPCRVECEIHPIPANASSESADAQAVRCLIIRIQGFPDYVPRITLPSIPRYHDTNMVLHGLNGGAALHSRHPLGKMGIPAKRVPAHSHSVGEDEFGNSVGHREIKLSRRGLH